MKIQSFLLGGALFLGAPLWAQNHDAAPMKAATNGDFSGAKATWNDVRDQTAELNALIAQNKLEGVHDAALGLRDTVRELRFGWSGLGETQRAQADDGIRKIDGLLDSLHEHADHNNPRGVAQDHRKLRVLLDQIAGAFPGETLQKVGPVVMTGTVQCPTMRMGVDTATAPAKAVYNGQTYYFCAVSEAEKFKREPAKFAAIYDEVTFGKPRVFTVAVAPTTGKIEAGRAVGLAFAIREQGKTALTTQFQDVHERKFHLIAVSDDLSWFGHVHPEQASDGRFYLKQTFPRDGRYFLYSDFTPSDSANTIVANEIRVGDGRNRAPQRLVPDQTLSKTVDGIRVDLKLSAPFQAGKQALLSYTLSKNGKPVTNMTPYLAAMGHIMAISQDGKSAVHTHTVSSGNDPVTGLVVTPEMSTDKGPTQSFKLELPTGGLYRVWAQFGVNGRIVTVPFTFNVQGNSNMKTQTKLAALAATAAPLMSATIPAQAAPVPKNAQRVTVSLPQGYKNGAATLKAGKPVALTFKLASDAGCGNVISVPAAKWTKTLQVGQSATVVYTPKKSGPLNFQCSMGHMKGTLTVK